jgi:hypothetical protein
MLPVRVLDLRSHDIVNSVVDARDGYATSHDQETLCAKNIPDCLNVMLFAHRAHASIVSADGSQTR